MCSKKSSKQLQASKREMQKFERFSILVTKIDMQCTACSTLITSPLELLKMEGVGRQEIATESDTCGCWSVDFLLPQES